MRLDRLISVVVPIQNDATIVGDFLDEVTRVLDESFSYFEVILVDDGSAESSQASVVDEVERREGVRLIQLSRAFGEEVAISAGLESAIGDYVVVMMPRTDPPQAIPELVHRCVEGHDVAYGVRRTVTKGRWLYRALAAVFYGYCSRFLDLDIPANTTHFKCFSRRAVNALLRINDPGRYLRVFSSVVGFKRIGSFEFRVG